MSEEENYSEFDMSDVIEDTEQYIETNPQNTEEFEDALIQSTSNISDSQINTSETICSPEKTTLPKSDINRPIKLPISRIKSIIKMDPDVSVINNDAAFLIAKATELFLETLAKETFSAMPIKKRKLITKKYLDHIIGSVDALCFLEEIGCFAPEFEHCCLKHKTTLFRHRSIFMFVTHNKL